MAKPLREMESFFQSLADATRLRILGLLLTGEVCVCHIHESLKIPQSKASRHLAYLRRAGLVDTRREGLWIYYRMAPLSDPVLQTISQAVAHGLAHMDVVRRDADRLANSTPASPRRAPADSIRSFSQAGRHPAVPRPCGRGHERPPD